MTSPVDRFSESPTPEQHRDRLNKMVAQLNANFSGHTTAITAAQAEIEAMKAQNNALSARIAALEALTTGDGK